MDFFEAQDEAHARSKWLIVYFFAAILMIVFAVYCAVTAGVFFYDHKVEFVTPPSFFSAKRFLITTCCVTPVIVLGSLWRVAQLRRVGGAGVAESLGGRLVDYSTRRPDERKLINVVEEMAIASGVPMPAVYVMDRETGLNAFAAGFSFETAVIGVTKGAIEQLDRDELQGVIAHEFSHILNGDMRLNTLLSGWIYGIVMLTILGRGFWQLIKSGGDDFVDGGGHRRRRSRGVVVGGGGRSGGDSKGNGGALILAVILVAVLITIIGFIGEIFARLIQAAVSRQREYLADASAVQFTRNPNGIGNALRRIGGIHRYSILRHPNASEFAHSFFAKSLVSEVSFLATHPPLPKRIGRVLRDWDGAYLKPRPKPETKRTEPKVQKKPKMDVAETLTRIGTDSNKMQTVLTAGLFLQQVGQLKESSRQFAEKVRLRLEKDWPEVLEAPDRSPGFLLALLFHEDDAVAAKQLEKLKTLFPGRVDRVETYGKRLRSIGRSERLLLLEILAARLPAALIESEYEDFLTCVDAFIEIDGEVLPFEIACLQIVKRQLLKDSDLAQRQETGGVVPEAASLLASKLLSEADVPEGQESAVLEGATKQSPFFMNQIEWVDSADAGALESAFDTLARTPFGIRKQFLEICERIVVADQKATIGEVELLRAVAIGIGVPCPPILPDLEKESAA